MWVRFTVCRVTFYQGWYQEERSPRFSTPAAFSKGPKRNIEKCSIVKINQVFLVKKKKSEMKWMTSFTKCSFPFSVVRWLQGCKHRNKIKKGINGRKQMWKKWTLTFRPLTTLPETNWSFSETIQNIYISKVKKNSDHIGTFRSHFH